MQVRCPLSRLEQTSLRPTNRKHVLDFFAQLPLEPYSLGCVAPLLGMNGVAFGSQLEPVDDFI